MFKFCQSKNNCKKYLCILLVAFFSGWQLKVLGCEIVFGDDWAFANQRPEGWDGVCGADAMPRTAITYWPAKYQIDQSDTYLYVTATKKELFKTIDQFVTDEQNRFKAKAPDVKFTMAKTSKTSKVDISNFFHVTFEKGTGKGHGERKQGGEYMVYLEGPTAYFIIAMTSTSDKTLQRHKDVFVRYVQNFLPMKPKNE